MSKDKKKPTAKGPTKEQLAEMEAANRKALDQRHARKALAYIERCSTIDAETCDELLKSIKARRDKQTPTQ